MSGILGRAFPPADENARVYVEASDCCFTCRYMEFVSLCCNNKQRKTPLKYKEDFGSISLGYMSICPLYEDLDEYLSKKESTS
ncbi:hypothetical protein LCGC14_1456260 [marine sediment metagenome]|uniref:Uncharacterized protein n=1 Tax=marine sediment metagenome TaxID=412755 RepID=A0A0F9MIA9_9ZZZZ